MAPKSALKKGRDDPNAVSMHVHFQGDLGQPATNKRKLRILHFNDIYNIQEKPKKQYKGGAARFVTAMRHYQEKAKEEGVDCLTLFSGDMISPSLISTMFEGE